MKKTIEDYEYNGKIVIIRCDLNVPIRDGLITDDTRIVASLKSLNYLLEHGAKVIVLSHLGKVKSEEDKKSNSLYPVYLKLKELLNYPTYFSKDSTGYDLEEMINSLNDGELILLENTRFNDYPEKLESNCNDDLSKYWASLGDIFINDAYGMIHRCHASNYGISKYLPSGLGFLVKEELDKIDELLNEETHPYYLLMGGKKISDKTLVIDNLINKCDKILIGGGMANTFLKAKGFEVGKSIVDDNNIEYCKNLLDKYSDKLVLPVDIVTNNKITVKVGEIDANDIGYDIGPETINLFKSYLSNAKRVIVNGPMGVFEENDFQKGTKELYECMRDNQVKVLIGGGDSTASVNLLGFSDCFYHISTGGGATLEHLTGDVLPTLSVISDK